MINRLVVVRSVSAVLLLALIAKPAFAKADLRVVATDRADTSAAASHRVTGERYTFSTDEVPTAALPAGDPLRTVLFGRSVRLAYAGADPAATYVARMTFVSDDRRVMSVLCGGASAGGDVDVPPHGVVRREWPVHPDADGVIDLRIVATVGPNAAVAAVVIASSSSTPLGIVSDPAKADREAMEHAVAALPSVPPVLSPIPATVDGVATPILPLDGTWSFSTSLPRGAEPDTSGWKPIAVPGEWAMQGFTVPTGTMACYARSFDRPADWTGCRVKLRFDAVNSVCRVWVNGRPVGEHDGCFVPFELDVTDALWPGTNRLLVGVQCESTSESLGCISQYAAHPVGGILRSARLVAVPGGGNIAGVVVTTPLSDGGRSASLVCDTSVSPGASGQVRLTLRSPAGETVPLENANSDVAGTDAHHVFTCAVANPKLWDTEHPNLYTLAVSLVRSDRVLETVVRRVGFRQVEVRGNQLLVNFRPVKLLGVCRHEIDPLTGRSVTAAQCRQDAELFRAANCNYVRTSHYPPSEAFLDAADELGLFVEDESALCWVNHGAAPIWKTWDYADPRFLPYLVRAQFEKMAVGRDHPSVVLWSLANESMWSPLWAEVQRRVVALDPTRPTTFHDQCWGGYNNAHSTAAVGVYHYPGLADPARCDREARPILFGEYAHIECYNRRELVTDPGMRDDWGRPFETVVDHIQSHPGCLGGAIWAGLDDVFHLPDGRIVGYGPWGVIDAWRRRKPEYWQVRNAYAPVQLVDRHAVLAIGTTELRLPVENRYAFTNLRECRIAWTLGDAHGMVDAADVAPRDHGDLVIQLPRPIRAGDRLALSVTDPRGFECASADLLAPSAIAAVPATHDSAAMLTTTDEAFEARTATAITRVDRHTGAVTIRTAEGRPLVGSLGLMVLPLNAATGGDGGHAGNDYQNHIAPFTPVCTAWKATGVAAAQADGAVTVTIDGAYAEAAGRYALRFAGDGTVAVGYDFAVTKSSSPRQYGFVLDVPATLDTLSWRRDAQWTTYPEDDIARPAGTARALPVHRDGLETPRQRLAEPWSADATDMGSNDFRSTKYHVTAAALTGADHVGIGVRSDGTASVRAWVDGPVIHLLVAAYHTGGADGFSSGLFKPERRHLAAGAHVTGMATLRFGSVDQP
jgi:hypothetical protein